MKNNLIWIGIFILLWFIVLNIDTRNDPEKNTSNKDKIQIEEEILNEAEIQREADSLNDYMRYWYKMLDTNSDGEID